MGAGGFFARIIRDYRKLHPDIKLSLCEMRTPEQMDALTAGRIENEGPILRDFLRLVRENKDRIQRTNGN